MSRHKPITYTTETGVENPEPPTVEQAIPTRVRIKDANYGLKTAVPLVRERVRAEQSRVAKLADVTAQLTRINTSLLRGTTSDRVKAIELRDKLVADRERLSHPRTHWSTPRQGVKA
jgi:hypothetical protein